MSEKVVDKGTGCGFSIGMVEVCAAVVSYALNHSGWWAFLHFFLGPFYLLWALFGRTKEIVPALRSFFL